MKFDYTTYDVDPSSTNPSGVVRRPEVLLRVNSGASARLVLALVDTGADESVLPSTLANSIGVTTDDANTIQAAGVGGQLIDLLPGAVELEITDGSESYKWRTVVGFARFENPDDECAILGHVGALEYFTATFDGEAHQLSLAPNGTLPKLK
jgi:aspartyl protease